MVNDNTNEKENSNNSDISRRKYIEGTGATAFGFTGLNFVHGQRNKTVTIPYAGNGEKVLKTKQVPEAWHNHVKHARDVKQKVTEQFLGQTGVKTIAKTRGPQSFGDLSGFQIRIEVDPERFRGEIPDQVDGIPVVKEEVHGPPSFGACGCTKQADPLLGGVPIEIASTCPVQFGTLGCMVKQDGNFYMLTAAHIFGGSCPTGISGDSAYNMGDYFGQVHDWDSEEDWVLIEEDSVEGFRGGIWDPSRGSRTDVIGHLYEIGVDNLISSGETVSKVGVTSGKETGTVVADEVSSNWDCVTYSGNGVESDILFADGDSGGPLYDEDSDGAYMVTINCGQPDPDTNESISCHPTCSNGDEEVHYKSRGTGFYHLYNNHGMTAP